MNFYQTARRNTSGDVTVHCHRPDNFQNALYRVIIKYVRTVKWLYPINWMIHYHNSWTLLKPIHYHI